MEKFNKSVSEMGDLTVKDNSLTRNAIILLDRILVELERLRIDRIIDYQLCKTIEHLVSELEKIRVLINENPRFDWVLLNNEIDNLFRRDKNLSGVIAKLYWAEGENWGFIKCNIAKQN